MTRIRFMSESQDLYLGKKSYSVLGQRPVRHDGADKVTGKAVYTSDLHLPNMAQGKVIRSPHAHAKIKSIYTAAALKLPGVLAVVTGEDWPNLEEKFAIMGEAGGGETTPMAKNCLAGGKKVFKRDAVAPPAATRLPLSGEAARLIKV